MVINFSDKLSLGKLTNKPKWISGGSLRTEASDRQEQRLGMREIRHTLKIF